MSRAIDPVIGCRALGAFRALHSFKDTFVLLHGLMGCHSGFAVLRLLQNNIDVRVMTTGMHQDDVVYGGEEHVYRAIVEVYRRARPRAIAVVECCASALIGDDIESAISRARRDGVAVPIVHIDGGGFHSDAKKGFEEALVKIYEAMHDRIKAGGRDSGSGRTVCFVGVKLDEYRAEQDMNEIRRLFKAMGIDVIYVPGSSVQALEALARCDILAVVGGDGIELARRVEKDFGVPYIVTVYPFGISTTIDMLYTIAKDLGVSSSAVDSLVDRELRKVRRVVEKSWIYLKTLLYSEALVIGSPGRALGLATMLSRDLQMAIRTVLTYYPIPVHSGIPIEVIEDRSAVVERIDDGVDIVFGSSFDEPLLRCRGIPIVEYDYPVLHKLALSSSPLAGFRGIATWIEEIVYALKVAKR